MKILFIIFLICLSVNAKGQSNMADSLIMLFDNQISFFPQEKLHLHTDKPHYISGERIWFRAHLVDATSHVPASVSRYVYVDLINPLDTIVVRAKIRNTDDAYHGYLLIPDDVPEGLYAIRAYTSFMRGIGEDYFFNKSIYISDPQARSLNIDAQFTHTNDNSGQVVFRFTHAGQEAPLVPHTVKMTVNEGRTTDVRVNQDGVAQANFNISNRSSKRIILLEATTAQFPYKKFIKIPANDSSFDVSFFPEGGTLMQGTPCKIAFKAMDSEGKSVNITGIIYDNMDTPIANINSAYLGMGTFMHLSEKGKTYYAVCQTETGQSKRFQLPTASDRGYALSINRLRDRITVSVLEPADSEQNNQIYLIAHTHGSVHWADMWNRGRTSMVFQQGQFPSGVVHFILTDNQFNPLSERLIFVNNNDQSIVSYSSDNERYASRSLVRNQVEIKDEAGQSINGNFSVSVSSDRYVTQDTTNNILTTLLLTSELRGHIENPAFYFQNTNAAQWALDLLMCTQGWRRYDIPEMLKGRFSRPSSPLEIGPEIAGTVKSVLIGRAIENVDVTILSFTGDYVEATTTDADGRFYFNNGELPDSTIFLVNVPANRGATRLEVIVDKETLPEITLPTFDLSIDLDDTQIARYANKADQQYLIEHGMRTYQISEVSITAERRPPRRSSYYSSPNSSITEAELERIPATDIRSLLMRLPGVMVSGNSITISNMGTPMLLIDDLPYDIADIEHINVHDIAQIDVLRDPSNTAMFGSRGVNGVIAVFTKDGSVTRTSRAVFNIKSFSPLGYQKAVEFYAPKYATAQSRNAQTPDLRTTIHWEPVVQTDSVGVAKFEFYTSDDTSSYTVIIEGITDCGKIIWQRGKLWRRD